MREQVITIFGGSGFVGRYIVKELAKRGYRINIICRHPSQATFLKTAGHVGQIVTTYCNINDLTQLRKVVNGSTYVIDLIGILYEKGKNTFEKIHKNFPENLAKICSDFGVKKFIYFSAMGIDKCKSKYAITKLEGERKIRTIIDNYFIIRPNVIFGEEDNFFNQFGDMSRYMPFLPAIGGGKNKFQPVYVGDLALAVANIIDNLDAKPGIYELAGPEKMTFKEILEYIINLTGNSTKIINLPFPVASFIAFFAQLFPKPLLTLDQLESLKFDCIQENRNVLTFKDLKINPTNIDLIVPNYLTRFKAQAA
ncbi:MAG: complex I NDUFA9 subunit family protein [Sphingobacteriia bacterium]|nr:complex I NDUFA9 subunit family protein [Sphingobacteriia bacterium]